MGGGSAPQAARREGGDVAFVFCPTAFEHLPRSSKLFNHHQPSHHSLQLQHFLPLGQIEQDVIHTK